MVPALLSYILHVKQEVGLAVPFSVGFHQSQQSGHEAEQGSQPCAALSWFDHCSFILILF